MKIAVIGGSGLIGTRLVNPWEVAAGICAPSVVPRDFPAVTLSALIGIALTFRATRRSRAGRTASA